MIKKEKVNPDVIYIKLIKQIEKLNDSKNRIDILIQCMRTDVSYNNLSKLSFEARVNSLERAKQNINDSVMFLEDLLFKLDRGFAL